MNDLEIMKSYCDKLKLLQKVSLKRTSSGAKNEPKVIWKLKDGVESSRPTWIPCSERLPSEDEEVLVCDKDGTMEVCDLETFGRGVGLKWTDKNGYECWLDVVAWMPLPKPYGERKESE